MKGLLAQAEKIQELVMTLSTDDLARLTGALLSGYEIPAPDRYRALEVIATEATGLPADLQEEVLISILNYKRSEGMLQQLENLSLSNQRSEQLAIQLLRFSYFKVDREIRIENLFKGASLIQDENPLLALVLYKRLVEIGPELDDAVQAVQLLTDGREWLDEAEELETLLEDAPESEQAGMLINLALIQLIIMEDQNDAIETLKKLLSRKLSHPALSLMIYRLFLRPEPSDQFLPLFKEALTGEINFKKAFFDAISFSHSAAIVKALLAGEIPSLEQLEELTLYAIEGHWERAIIEQIDELNKPSSSKDDQIIFTRFQARYSFFQERDFEEAEKHAKKVQRLDPRGFDLDYIYMTVYKEAGNYRKVLELLTRQVRTIKDKEEQLAVYLDMAEVAELAENTFKAIDSYKSILKLQPGHPAALNELKRIYREGEKWRALVDLLKSELTKLEKDTENNKELIVQFYEELIDLSSTQLKQDPTMLYKKVLKIDPGFIPALDFLMEKSEQGNRWNEYIKLLIQKAEAVTNPDEQCELYFEIADLYTNRMRKPQESPAYLEKLLDINPRHKRGLDQLKEFYLAGNDQNKIFEVMVREVAVYEDSVQQTELLRNAYDYINEHLNGDKEQQERVLKYMLEVDGDNLFALRNRLELAEERGDITVQKDMLLSLYRLTPDGEIILKLAKIFDQENQENPDKPFEQFESPVLAELSRVDVDPVSVDVDPVSIEVDPVSVDVDPISVDVDPVSIDVDPVSVDVDPVSVDVDPVSIDVDPVSVDVDPVSVDVDPVSVDVDQPETSLDFTLKFYKEYLAYDQENEEIFNHLSDLYLSYNRYLELDQLYENYPHWEQYYSIIQEIIKNTTIDSAQKHYAFKAITVSLTQLRSQEQWLSAANYYHKTYQDHIPTIDQLVAYYDTQEDSETVFSLLQEKMTLLTASGDRDTLYVELTERYLKLERSIDALENEKERYLDLMNPDTLNRLSELGMELGEQLVVANIFKEITYKLEDSERKELLFNQAIEAFVALEQFETARDLYFDLTTLNPEEESYVDHLVEILKGLEDYSGLDRAYTMKLTFLDDDGKADLYDEMAAIAHQHLLSDQLEQNYLEALLKLNSSHLDGIERLLALYHKLEQPEEWIRIARMKVAISEEQVLENTLIAIADRYNFELIRYEAGLDAIQEAYQVAENLEVLHKSRNDLYETKYIPLAEFLFSKYDLQEIYDLQGEIYNKIIDTFSLDLESEKGYRIRAISLFEEKLENYQEAYKHKKALFLYNPTSNELLNDLERLSELKGDFSDMVETLVELKETTKEKMPRINYLARLGKVYDRYLNDTETAQKYYGEILEEDGNNLTILNELEQIYKDSENYEMLQDILERKLKLLKDPEEKLAIKIEMARVKGLYFDDIKGALLDLDRIIEVDEEAMPAYETKKMFYEMEQDLEGIASVLLQVEQQQLKDLTAYYETVQQLVVLYEERMEAPDRAVEHFIAVHDVVVEEIRQEVRKKISGLMARYELYGEFKGEWIDFLSEHNLWEELDTFYQILIEFYEDERVRTNYYMERYQLSLSRFENQDRALENLVKALYFTTDNQTIMKEILSFMKGYDRFDHLIQSIEAGIANKKDTYDIYQALADLFEKRGEQERKDYFDLKVVEANPSDETLYEKLLERYQGEENYAVLKDLYVWRSRVCELDDKIDLLSQAATIQFEILNEPYKSAPIYEEMFYLDRSESTLNTLESIYYDAQNWMQLVSVYKKAVPLFEGEMDERSFHDKIVRLELEHLHRYEDTILHVERLIELEPDEIEHYKNLEQLYINLKNFEKLDETYQKQLEFTDDDERFCELNYLKAVNADTYLKNSDDAITSLGALLEREPYHQEGLSYLERFITQPEWILKAAPALEETYKILGKWEELSDLLEKMLGCYSREITAKALETSDDVAVDIALDEPVSIDVEAMEVAVDIEDSDPVTISVDSLEAAVSEDIPEVEVAVDVEESAPVTISIDALEAAVSGGVPEVEVAVDVEDVAPVTISIDALEAAVSGDTPKIEEDVDIEEADPVTINVSALEAAVSDERVITEVSEAEEKERDVVLEDVAVDQSDSIEESEEISDAPISLPELSEEEIQEKSEILKKLTEIYQSNLNQFEPALKFALEYFELNPADDMMIDVIESLSDITGNYTSFIHSIDSVLAIETDDEELILNLLNKKVVISETYIDNRRVVVAALQALKSRQPEMIEWYEKLSIYLEELEDYPALITVLSDQVQVIDDVEEKINLYFRVSEIYKNQLNQFSEAITTYETILELDDHNLMIFDELEALLDILEDQALQFRILEILEKAYLNLPEWSKYVWIVSEKLKHISEPEKRKEIYLILAESYLSQLGDLDEAFQALIEAFKLDHDQAIAERLFSLINELGNYDLLVEVLEEELPRISSDELIQLIYGKLGGIYFEFLGDFDKATDYFLKVNQYLENLEILTRLEVIYQEAVNFSELEQVYLSMLPLLDEDELKVETYVKLANLQEYELNKIEATINSYNGLIEVKPDHIDALKALERLYGENADSLCRIYKLLLEAPIELEEQAEYRYKLAAIYKQSDDTYDQAELLWQEILEGSEEKIDAYRELITYYQIRENWSKQGETLTEFISYYQGELDEDELLNRYITLADLYNSEDQLNSIEEALEYYQKALVIQPQNLKALINAEKIFTTLDDQMERFERIREILQTLEAGYEEEQSGYLDHPVVEGAKELSLNIKETLLKYYNSFELLLIESEGYDEMIEIAQRHLDVIPHDPVVVGRLEDVYEKMGMFEELLYLLEDKLEIMDDQDSRRGILIKIATTSRKELGDSEKAIEAYQNILNIFPGDVDTIKDLEGVYEELEQWDELVTLLGKKLTVVDDRYDTYCRMVEISMQYTANFEFGYETLATAIRLYPDDEALLNLLNQSAQQSMMWDSYIDTAKIAYQVTEDFNLKIDLLMKMAVAYRDELGAYDKAIETYKLLASNLPEEKNIQIELENLYNQEGDWQRLAITLEKIIELEDDADLQREYFYKLAAHYEDNLDDIRKAASVYERLIKDYPEEMNALDQLERIYLDIEQSDHLVQVYHNKITLFDDPFEKIEHYEKIAQIARDEEKSQLLIDSYRAITKLDPNHREAFEILEEAFTESKQADALIDVLSDLISGESEYQIEYMVKKALLLEEQEDGLEGAITIYQEILDQLDPTYSGAVDQLSRIYYQEKRWEDLIQLNKKRLEFEENEEKRLDSYNLVASVYLKEFKDSTSAREYFEYALNERSDDRNAVAGLTEIFTGEGQWEEMIELLSSVAGTSDDEDQASEAYFDIGMIYLEQMEDLASAQEAFQNAVDRKYNHTGALKQLKLLAYQQGALEDAISYLENLKELLEDTTELVAVNNELGQLFYQLEDEGNAIYAFEASMELKENTAAAEKLSELYFKAEDAASLSTLYNDHQEMLLAGSDTPKYLHYYRNGYAKYQQGEDLQGTYELLRRSFVLNRVFKDNLELLFNVASKGEKHETVIGVSKQMLVHYFDEYENTELGNIYVKLGVAHAGIEAFDKSGNYFNRALTIDSYNVDALKYAVDSYRKGEQWFKVIEYLSRMLQQTFAEDEKVGIYEEIALIYKDHLNNQEQALKYFNRAVEGGKRDEVILGHLYDLYMGMEDFRNAIIILEEQLKLTQNGEQQINLCYQIADLYYTKIGDIPQAISYLANILKLDYRNSKVLGVIEQILKPENQYEKLEETYRYILGKCGGDDLQLKQYLLTQLGGIYKDITMNYSAAVSVYEQLYQLNPNQVEYRQLLLDFYERMPEYYDKAITLRQSLIAGDLNASLDSVHALIRLYSERQEYDKAYCYASALVHMGAAQEDEQSFYDSYKPVMLRTFSQALSEPVLKKYIYDKGISDDLIQIFRKTAPIIASFFLVKKLKHIKDIDPKKDLINPQSRIANVAKHVFSSLALDQVEIYHAKSGFKGIRLENTKVPTVIVGSDLMSDRTDSETVSFLGRHLFLLLPEYYLIQIAETIGVTIYDMFNTILSVFNSAVSVHPKLVKLQKLLKKQIPSDVAIYIENLSKAGQIDLNKWLNMVEKAANRVALVLSGDLLTTIKVIKEDQTKFSKLSTDQKIADLAKFATTSKFFELREALDITIKVEQ